MGDRKKRRKSFFDDIFGFSIFDEIDEFFEKAFGEFGSLGEGFSGSYSISVTYTDEGPVVYAEVSDNINREEFRKMLEKKYPGAKIVIKGGHGEKSKFEVISRESEGEKRVEIKLGEEEKESREEESIFDMLYGKRRTQIVREDEQD